MSGMEECAGGSRLDLEVRSIPSTFTLLSPLRLFRRPPAGLAVALSPSPAEHRSRSQTTRKDWIEGNLKETDERETDPEAVKSKAPIRRKTKKKREKTHRFSFKPVRSRGKAYILVRISLYVLLK